LVVGDELLVDDVGDASFQRSEGFFLGFAFSLFLVVVDAAWCVVADLGDAGCLTTAVIVYDVARLVDSNVLGLGTGIFLTGAAVVVGIVAAFGIFGDDTNEPSGDSQ
jgi:hypothetical protein